MSLLWSHANAFRLEYPTINLNRAFIQYTVRTKLWVSDLSTSVSLLPRHWCCVYVLYENPQHALPVLLNCLKLFYTRFNGRTTTISSHNSTFLLRKVRFLFLRAFGSLPGYSKIKLFSFKHVTDVAVVSASRWFTFMITMSFNGDNG